MRARDGNRPFSAPLLDSSGNIYETNGEGSFSREGSVLELNKLGEPKLLFSWGLQHRGSFDGSFPRAGLIRDQAGNLYGTTSLGGTGAGGGTVYKIDHPYWRVYAALQFRGSAGRLLSNVTATKSFSHSYAT